MKYIPDETCSVCGKPFTEAAWNNRHTDPRDGMSDCHAGCCPKCKYKPRRIKSNLEKNMPGVFVKKFGSEST